MPKYESYQVFKAFVYEFGIRLSVYLMISCNIISYVPFLTPTQILFMAVWDKFLLFPVPHSFKNLKGKLSCSIVIEPSSSDNGS